VAGVLEVNYGSAAIMERQVAGEEEAA